MKKRKSSIGTWLIVLAIILSIFVTYKIVTEKDNTDWNCLEQVGQAVCKEMNMQVEQTFRNSVACKSFSRTDAYRTNVYYFTDEEKQSCGVT
jgi:hypothetical protein